MQRVKRLIVSTLGAALAIMPVAVPVTVHAQSNVDIRGNLCAGVNLDVGDTDCKEESGVTQANDLIRNIINIFSLVVGVVAVIMIIVGGFKYITSGGDASSVSAAKNTILYAIIGLVVVALAQFIVRFVFSRVQTTQ